MWASNERRWRSEKKCKGIRMRHARFQLQCATTFLGHLNFVITKFALASSSFIVWRWATYIFLSLMFRPSKWVIYHFRWWSLLVTRVFKSEIVPFRKWHFSIWNRQHTTMNLTSFDRWCFFGALFMKIWCWTVRGQRFENHMIFRTSIPKPMPHSNPAKSATDSCWAVGGRVFPTLRSGGRLGADSNFVSLNSDLYVFCGLRLAIAWNI